MPPSSLNKKLKPAKRAWKSFTNMVKSKFRDLQIHTSIRDSTTRTLEFLSRRMIVPFRTRYLRNSNFRAQSYKYNHNHSNYKKANKTSRFIEFLSRIPFKTRHFRKPNFHKYRYKYNIDESEYEQIHQHQSQRGSDILAVYVDKFYGERRRGMNSEGASGNEEGTAGQKEKEEEDEGSEIVDSIEDAWRAVVAASPHLRVDERAEEFIFKFREEIRIEKERSLLEFQERLKRSA